MLIEEVDQSIDEPDIEDVNASFTSSCVSLTKTMLGTGILAMPAVFATVGYIPGLSLLLIAMLFSILGQYLLILAAQSSDSNTNVSIVECCQHIHPYASLVFDLAIAVKSMGVSASYLMVIGDSMTDVLETDYVHPFLYTRILWITLAMFIITPLSLKRSMDALKRTSIAGIFVAVYLIIIAAVQFVKNGKSELVDNVNFVSWSNLLHSFSVFVFGFTCHQNVFPVYNESKNKSPRYMLKVIATSTAIAAAIYTPFALLSYLSFGRECSGNVFNNYDRSLLVNLGRGMMTLLAAFTIPLQMMPFRRSMLDMMSVVGVNTDREKSERTVTIIALAVSYTVAILVVDLKTVVAIIGHSAGIPVCYFLPPTLYIMSKNLEKPIPFKALAILLVLVGIVAQWTF